MSDPPSAAAPPHLILGDFLPPETAEAMLTEALAMESRFKPSTVNYGSGGQSVDPQFRISLLADSVPQRLAFQTRLQQALPRLMAGLPVVPFVPTRMEVELAAHGDGAFFSRHQDAPAPAPDPAQSGQGLRMISGVYYLHGRPKGFRGGALRLYGESTQAPFTDIAPTHNSLVVFASWLPHEVMPVACPSRRFADSRFAINCWFHGVPKR